MRIILFSMIFTVANTAMGGGTTVGNGGKIIRCEHSHKELGNERIAVVDLYEANLAEPGATRALVSNDYREIATGFLSQLAALDRDRYNNYMNQLQQFEKDWLFAENLHLPDIADEDVIQLPEHDCTIETAAFQRDPVFSGERRFFVRSEIWRDLSKLNKAVLVLHELVYREAHELGQSDARRARRFVRELLNYKMQNMRQDQYSELLTLVGLTPRLTVETQVGSISLDLRTVTRYGNGAVKSGKHLKTSSADYYDLHLKTGPISGYDSEFNFSPSGLLTGISAGWINWWGRVEDHNVVTLPSGCKVNAPNPKALGIDDQGNVIMFVAPDGLDLDACLLHGHTSTAFRVAGTVNLYPTGFLSSCELISGATFLERGGKAVFVERGVTKFDSDGYIVQ